MLKITEIRKCGFLLKAPFFEKVEQKIVRMGRGVS